MLWYRKENMADYVACGSIKGLLRCFGSCRRLFLQFHLHYIDQVVHIILFLGDHLLQIVHIRADELHLGFIVFNGLRSRLHKKWTLITTIQMPQCSHTFLTK